MKSIQKRKLESLVTEEGMFDTSYFEKVSLKGLLEGAIQYDHDREADLAEVEDIEDREMLQAAERERKDVNKEDEQEELEVEVLLQELQQEQQVQLTLEVVEVQKARQQVFVVVLVVPVSSSSHILHKYSKTIS